MSALHAYAPDACEDAYDALVWIVEHADRLDLEADRPAAGGDSAGGTLTAAVNLMARDRGGPDIAYQYMVFPALDSLIRQIIPCSAIKIPCSAENIPCSDV